jgi:hypothetical protein
MAAAKKGSNKKSGSKPKKGKLTKAQKKAQFLANMKKGRAKAKRAANAAAAAKSTKPKKKHKVKKAPAAAAKSTKPKKKKKAAAAAATKPKKKKTKAAKKAANKAAARRRSKKTVSTHGTIVVAGKAQPINVRVSMAERGAQKRAAAKRRSGGGRRYHSNPMVMRSTAVYENPMTAGEFAIGAALSAIGAVGASMLDRYLATRPFMANGGATPAAATNTTMTLVDATTSAPGMWRIGAQVVLAAAPLVGSHWAGPKLRAGLQGFSIGVGARLITQLFEHYVLVKMMAPKDANGNLLAATTGAPTSLIQRLYSPEIQADADRATVAATTAPPGLVSGPPRVAPRTIPQGVGAPKAVYGRDPGPRATPAAGVGNCAPGTGGGTFTSTNPACQPCNESAGSLLNRVTQQSMSEGAIVEGHGPMGAGKVPTQSRAEMLAGLGLTLADTIGMGEAAAE